MGRMVSSARLPSQLDLYTGISFISLSLYYKIAMPAGPDGRLPPDVTGTVHVFNRCTRRLGLLCNNYLHENSYHTGRMLPTVECTNTSILMRSGLAYQSQVETAERPVAVEEQQHVQGQAALS